MLMTKLKSKEAIDSLTDGKVFIINCHGCKEVGFPEAEARQLQKELAAEGKLVGTMTADYICNPGNMKLRLQSRMAEIAEADAVLVLSCGVGVQTVASYLEEQRHLPHYRLLQEPGQRSLRRNQERYVRGQPRYGMRLGADLPPAGAAGQTGSAALPHPAARFQHG